MLSLGLSLSELAGRVGGDSATPGGGDAPAAPVLSLSPASDSGSSNSDGITNVTEPTFNLVMDNPAAGDLLHVYDGGVLLDSYTLLQANVDSLSFSMASIGPLSEGAHSITVRHEKAGAVSVASNASTPTIDTTPPTLSSPTGTQTGSTTATVGVTTNEANGTLHTFISTSSTPPSAANLKAGTGAVGTSADQTISSTGAKSVSVTGLTAATAYYAHFLHEDAAGNNSSIATSAQFTTAAGSSSLSYTQTDTETSGDLSGKIITFSGKNIGTAASDRIVVVALQMQGHASTSNITATCGGVAMTQEVINNGPSGYLTAIFSLLVTSGTSAAIVFTATNADAGSPWSGDMRYTVGTITGSAAASVTSVAEKQTGTESPVVIPSLTIPTGGMYIGSVVHRWGDPFTWSGVTFTEAAGPAGSASGATGHRTTAGAYSASVTHGSAGSSNAAVAAVWTP